MQYHADSGAALEILARIVCSVWMTRSWILQEGVLARECVFQFKNRAIDPVHEWCLYGPRPAKATRALSVSFPFPFEEEYWHAYEDLYNILWDMLHQDWKSRYRKDPPSAVAHRVSHVKVVPNLRGFRASYAAGRIYTLPAIHGLSERDQNGLGEMDHLTMQLSEEHQLKQLVDTWNELAHRSTTMRRLARHHR